MGGVKAGFPHLHVQSNFSFLRGASTCEDLVDRAAALHTKTAALTDYNSVSGLARFAQRARQYGIRPIAGTTITLADGHTLVLLAQNKTGYANICRLLTKAYAAAKDGTPLLSYAALAAHNGGLIALSGARDGLIPYLLLAGRTDEALVVAQKFREMFGAQRFVLQLHADLLPRTARLNQHLNDLAAHLDLKTVATGPVYYADKDGFSLHDLLTCIRTKTTLHDVHPQRSLNAENYWHSLEIMKKRFSRFPQAVMNAYRIADMCQDSFPAGERLLPSFAVPPGKTPASLLRDLTFSGAKQRYGTLTPHINQRLNHELSVICQLGVESYFLIVWDLLRFAQRQNIRYTGRGSAADSAVAYCLRITEVDPIARNLLFERFLSLERAQIPDIDVDFDARHRDAVAAYVTERYGKAHVASVCTFHTYRARSAARDLGKAMGMPTEELERFVKSLPSLPADAIDAAIQCVPELRDSGLPFERYEQLVAYCARIAGFPRHIGTHIGGLVVSQVPLITVSPIQRAAGGAPIIQFDKHDIDALGLIKIDLLSLRTLSAIDDTVAGINVRRPSDNQFDTDHIPLDDTATYEMLSKGDNIGVFQLESPAQRSLQTRLDPQNIEHIIASVALIRPGPIQSRMVEPFIARRRGEEAITYLHPALEPILAKTYGVVLYQEQVIEIATVIAGFTPGEADTLRKVMTSYRRQKELDDIGAQFVQRATRRGVLPEKARDIFALIQAYAGYGFCEAHAAAFGDTAYKTAYLIKHYPEHFFAAILNNYPMGFYSLNTICLTARNHGITLTVPDINESAYDCTVTDRSILIGLKFVHRMPEQTARQIIIQRDNNGPFTSLANFCRRVSIPISVLERLVLSGAFDTLQPNRRALMWQATRQQAWYMPEQTAEQSSFYGGQTSLLQAGLIPPDDEEQNIADFPPFERTLREYESLGFNPATHPMEHFRDRLLADGITDTRGLFQTTRKTIRITGLVIRPHKPPNKSGRPIVFFSLEDEFGQADVTVFPDVYETYGRLIYHVPFLTVTGAVQRRGRGIVVIAKRIEPFSP